MKCKKCREKAVLSDPNLCRKHFIEYFEKKVSDTIEKYDLIKKGDKICVATSGGKDSTAVMYIIRKLFPKNKLQALAIDEGIKGYRDKTLLDLKKFCTHNKIELKIISFKKEFKKTLDEIIRSKKTNLKPCNICGTLRRYLLNKHSRGFDVIITGHNLDDEAQAILMNLFRSQIDVLARLGPKTGISERKQFTQRVKPLYFCSEKESALYALLKGFDVSFNECPYVIDAYRADIRDMLNSYESVHKGTKLNIVKSFLKTLPNLKKRFASSSPVLCSKCGEPSSKDVCNACRLAIEIGK
jgi:uncharacterized protein (TIGR00269 family)